MNRILHIVQESTKNPRHQFLGSVKDTLARTEYFAKRGIEVDRIVAEDRSDEKLAERLRKHDLKPYRIALFELPLYPRSLQLLRRKAPHVKRWTRPINAEFYHQLHLFRAHRAYPFMRLRRADPMHDLIQGVQRLRLDRRCARRSDIVLSISDWETEHYWRWVAGPQRTRTLPYFMPASLVTKVPKAVEKEPLCICPLSSSHSIRPFSVDAVHNFSRLVRTFQAKDSTWKFAITGSTMVATPLRHRLVSHLLVKGDIELMGYLEDPLEPLARASAVALLSDLGFGVKTKILDAIAARCWVLVSSGLYRRLPDELRPYCLEVPDLNHIRGFKKALQRALLPFPAGDPNAELQARAYRLLDELMEIS